MNVQLPLDPEQPASVGPMPSVERTPTVEPPIARREAFVAGLLAGSVAAFVLLAGSAVTGVGGFLETIHNGATRYVPVPLFDAAITALGALAKSLLFVGIVAVLVLAGGVIAVLLVRFTLVGRQSRWVDGLAVGALAWLIAELVVLPLFGAGFFGSASATDPQPLHVPLGVATVCYGLVLVGLLRGVQAPALVTEARTAARPADRDARTGDPATAPIARRTFLGGTLVLLGLAAFAGTVVSVAARLGHALTVGASGARRAQAPGGFGPTPEVTPVEDFYVVGKDLLPTTVDPRAWQLVISGLVDHPRSYSLEEIRALPAVEDYRTLECISNEVVTYGRLISTQRWKGVRARDVLEAAGLQGAATHVLWRSMDGYVESLPISVAMDELTWLAYEMGPPGTPLTADHGFPLRVLIAGRYGMKQPKYLVEMRLADHNEEGYWEQRGWDETAAVRTYSRIDEPLDGDEVPSDRAFGVYGIANAGDRGIARVELSADGGATWRDAELETPLSALTWVRWRLQMPAAGVGRLTLVARATDGQGNIQDATPRPSLPSGATGLHAITITAVPGMPTPAASP